MDFNSIDDIKELIRSIDNSKIMDFELKLQEDVYIKMSKHKVKQKDNFNNINNISNIDNTSNLDNPEKSNFLNIDSDSNISNSKINNNLSDYNSNHSTNYNSNINTSEEEYQKLGEVVKSPIVGTFYSSSSPDKPNFVNIGDKVKVGDVLCIVEAMKVMNEIKSNYSGEIAEVFANNEDMVEYNQELFRII